MGVSDLKLTEKLQSLWLVAAIIIGLNLGRVSWFSENAVHLIVLLFLKV